MEALSQILLLTPCDKDNGIHSLVGVIHPNGAYTSEYNTAFPLPIKLEIYDATMIRFPTKPQMDFVPQNSPSIRHITVISLSLRHQKEENVNSS